MTDKPDFLRAQEKIQDATNWRGSVNVNIGDETLTFGHRLLTESEFIDIKKQLNLSELRGGDKDNLGQTEAQERLLELQQKDDDLTEDEKAELEELTQEVAGQTDQIEDMLGENGYEALMEKGRACIEPTKEDVDHILDSRPSEIKEHLGYDRLPEHITRDIVRERMSDQLADMVSEQPYPIKLNVGMQSLSETISVLGNGLQD